MYYHLTFDRSSFHAVLDLPSPKCEESRDIFTRTLSDLFHSHQSVIPNLARGFMVDLRLILGVWYIICHLGKYMSTADSRSFLDEIIRARIGIRVIAEHYLSLLEPRNNWVGVVNTEVSPRNMINVIGEQISSVSFG
jgi:hypothetical protein